MSKTITVVVGVVLSMTFGAGVAQADNFPIPTWPNTQQAEQGTWDDPTGSYSGDMGTYDELLDIIDEDGAHPGTLEPAGPVH